MTDNNNSIVPAPSPIEIVLVDDYSDLTLSENAEENLSRIISNARAGMVTAAPLICKGPTNCVFKSRCPIYLADGEQSQYPLNKQCIVEAGLVNQKYYDYIEQFQIKHDLRTDPSTRSLISSLVSIDLWEYRINLILAGVGGESDGSLLIRQLINITEVGEEIEQLAEHPAWKIRVMLERMRENILDSLIATPKRQAWEQIGKKKVDNDSLVSRQLDVLEKFAAIEASVIQKEDDDIDNGI